MYLEDLTIHSRLHDYKVRFQNNKNFIEDLSKIENGVFVVDKNVWDNYGKSALSSIPESRLIVQESKESIKNMDTVCALYKKIMEFAPRKNMVLISMGGGIIQDITGFVASTLYRGITWIFVPTTLLAQVDSCIGAKTSLNFCQFKNLVGSFFPPNEIYLFPALLNTLTEEDYYSGVGELVKLQLMAGEEQAKSFIHKLPAIERREEGVLLDCIGSCLRIKQSFIEEDEFDTGRRNLLNYGHCFGHAIESSTNFAVPHGQAVVLGMMLANRVSVHKGLLSSEKEQFILNNMLKPVLKTKVSHISVENTLKAMHQDKKNIGKKLSLIMLCDDFSLVKIVDMNDEDAVCVLNEFFK